MNTQQIRGLRPMLPCFLKRFDDCFARKGDAVHLSVYVEGPLANGIHFAWLTFDERYCGEPAFLGASDEHRQGIRLREESSDEVAQASLRPPGAEPHARRPRASLEAAKQASNAAALPANRRSRERALGRGQLVAGHRLRNRLRSQHGDIRQELRGYVPQSAGSRSARRRKEIKRKSSDARPRPSAPKACLKVAKVLVGAYYIQPSRERLRLAPA